MTDKNLGEEALNSQLLRDLEASAGNAAKQEGMLSAAEKALAQRVTEQTAAQQQLADSIHLASVKLVSFGTGLGNNAGNDFSSMNKVIDATTKVMGGLMSMIPYVGGALDGIAKGAGEVAKFMVTTFAKAYGNFEKLSDTGIVTTFHDFKLNSDATGLTFADTTKIMGQYSKEIARFGGSALAGAKRFQVIANDSKDVSIKFQKIGISAADFSDFQLNYINQQTLAGRTLSLSDKQIVDGTKSYIEQLDDLAKLTGKTRKELQEELNSRMGNARYLAGITQLPAQIKKTVDQVLVMGTQLAPEIGDSLLELISTNGIGYSDDASNLRLALSMGGLNNQFFEDIKKGKYTPEEATNMIDTALGKYSESQTLMTSAVGSASAQTRFVVEGRMAAIRQLKRYTGQQNDIAKDRQKVIDSTDDANDAAAKTRRSMYGTTRNIDALATSSETMTKIMNGMADGINTVTEELYKFLGDEVPEYIKLQREENKKQTEVNLMRRDLNKQLELEAKLKTVDQNSEEAFKIKDQLNTIWANHVGLFSGTLKEQLVVAQKELIDLNTRRVLAEKKELDPKSSSAASTSGTSSGTPTSGTSSGTPTSGTSSGTPTSGTSSGTPTSGTTGTSGTPGTPGSSEASQSTTASSATTGASGPLPTTVGTGPEGWLQVYALAKAAGDKYPEVTASQWAVESGWGKHMSGKNNPFGQKAGSQEPGTVVSTREVVNGRSVMMDQKFKDYSSSLEAISEHVRRWSPKYSTAKSPEEAISMIARQYATGPDYANLVSQIIRQQKNAIPTASTASSVAAAPSATPVGANLGTSGAVQVSGSSTGYTAALAGTAMVIPANSGSEASAVAQQTSSTANHLKIAKLVSSRLDKAIDITQQQTRDTRATVNI